MVSLTSFEILPLEPNGEIQDNLQTPASDFVVFPSTVGVPDGQLNNLSSASLHSIVDSAVPDMTAAEMCDRLKMLLHENIELKDKLQKNNKVMHEQLNTIASWHDQIAQSNSKHRAMLENLVKQNQKLQSEKEELENIIKQQHEKEEAEKLASDTTDKNQHMCEDCSLLKEKLRELEEQLESTVTIKENIADELVKQQKTQEDLDKKLQAITSELSEFQSKCNILKNEKEELAVISDCLTTELTNLRCQREESHTLATVVTDDESDYAIIIKEDVFQKKNEECKALNDSLAQCHKLQTALGKAMQDLEEEKLKSEDLARLLKEKQGELKLLQGDYEECNKEKENMSSTVTVLNDKQNKLLLSISELQNCQEKSEMLEVQVNSYKERLTDLLTSDAAVIGNLQKQLKSLEEELRNERLENSLNKKSLLETENNFELFLEKHDQLLKKGEDYEQNIKSQTEEASKIMALETMKNQEQLDTLTAKLVDMEQYLQAEQDKVCELKGEIQTLTKESECIPILKAQVEVYKDELEKENRVRSSAEEKEVFLTRNIKQLEEQIKNLQEMLQNQQHSGHKHRAVRRYPDRSWSGSSFPGRSNGVQAYSVTVNQHPVPQDRPVVYSCPCCEFTFKDLQSLENHVEICLTES